MLYTVADIGAARKGRMGNRRVWARIPLLLAGLACGSGKAARAETIGSWVLTCPEAPAGGGCTLRHKDAFLQLGGVTAALEVRRHAEALVPVVVLSGLGAQAALAVAGSVTVSLRLDGGAWAAMPCAVWLVCAPAPADVTGFPAAHEIALRVGVAIPGGPALPPVVHGFALSGTDAALRRLRAAGEVEPAEQGLDMEGLMRKLWGR
jgi:hypothetical protein